MVLEHQHIFYPLQRMFAHQFHIDQLHQAISFSTFHILIENRQHGTNPLYHHISELPYTLAFDRYNVQLIQNTWLFEEQNRLWFHLIA